MLNRPASNTLAAAAALLLAATPAAAGPAAAQSQPIASAALQADLRLAVETIESTHPDLSHSVDRAAFARAVKDVEAQLTRPMSRDEAWAALSRLNPVLADGHLFIGFTDWRGESRAALQQGTAFFPFEVALDAAGNPTITAALGGGQTPLAGARIKRINGVDARTAARRLLTRVHGDTPAFRTALLAQRWWLYYWKIFGAPAHFDLELEGAPQRKIRIPAGREVPAVVQREASFEQLFQCELLPDNSALLTVSAFFWSDKERFFAFTRDCFSRIRAAGAETLIVDVRQNGGGDDDMWKKGILHYIADRPYKFASHYRKRVLAAYRNGDEVTGQVVTGVVTSETPPALDEPLRFTGAVYVLVGPLTYSSAILFSNVVQDYRFGTLAGIGGAVRPRQSGSVQTLPLPGTGLVLNYPRFVLNRPSGNSEPQLLQPDLLIKEDPLRPRAAVDALLSLHKRRVAGKNTPPSTATQNSRP